MAIDLKNSALLKVLQPLRSHFIVAAAFSLFINMLMIVPAMYMLQVFDRAVGSNSQSTLLMLTLLMVMLMASLGFLEWVRSQVLVRAGAKMDELLSERLFNLSFKQSLYSGTSNSQALSDLNSIRQFMTGNGLFAFFDAPWTPIYIAIMFMFHSYFGVLAMLSVIFLGALAYTNQKLTDGLISEANKEAMWSNNFTNRNLRNAEVVESMGMLASIRERWKIHSEKVINLQSLASDKAGMLTAISKSSRTTLQSLALGMGAYLAINQEISPGMMIAGSILLGRALAPVDLLVGSWKQFVGARAQFERIDDMLTRLPESEEKMELPVPTGAISAEGLSAAPPGSRVPVLLGISFNLPAGTAVGVIGPSAAGKSTLARVILGIWPALAGAMRLDGADVFQWDREELGPHIGYLPQDIELFDGTISENIARFGEIDAEKIVEASRLAGVHEMVLKLVEGYDTKIGAGGTVLSGGQRQRIGLARAVYGDPRLVVLDEPNSNLDDVGDIALGVALAKLKEKGTTLIVISHRLTILSSVDKLMVMKEGRIVDFGGTEEVMKNLQQAQALAPAKKPKSLTTTVPVGSLK